MTAGGLDGDRAAVLETVRGFFSDAHAKAADYVVDVDCAGRAWKVDAWYPDWG